MPAGRHQSADGQRIEGLVQEDDHEGAEAEQPTAAGRTGFSLHTCSQSDTVDERVESQAERGSGPGELTGRLVGQGMSVRVVVMVTGFMALRGIVSFGISVFRNIVVVEMEKALDKKHDEKSRHQPACGDINRLELIPGMRQQVQDSDAQHESGDETDGDLQPRVSEPNKQRNPPAGKGSEQNQRAIDRQQHIRRERGRVHFGRQLKESAEFVSFVLEDTKQTVGKFSAAKKIPQPDGCGIGNLAGDENYFISNIWRARLIERLSCR